MKNLFLGLILSLVSGGFASAKDILEKKDLQDNWQVFENNTLRPFREEQSVNTIYFTVDPHVYRGDFLAIRSYQSFDIFINGKLVSTNAKSTMFSIDSLANIHGVLQVAIHQTPKIKNLSTHIVSKLSSSVVADEGSIDRPTFFFRDFVVLALLSLIIFFLILVRINPRLAVDYFSTSRMFSLRESEDSQSFARIRSASILFYVFVSLVAGFFFLIVAHFTPTEYQLSLKAQPSNFLSTLFHWFKLSFFVLGVIFLKSFIVHAFAFLFGFSDAAAFHFFNFIRIVLILFVAITLLSVTFYLLQNNSKEFYGFLFKSIRVLLFLWILLMFLKLGRRANFSRFHLFSYLCATEILPLLIIAKVLYE